MKRLGSGFLLVCLLQIIRPSQTVQKPDCVGAREPKRCDLVSQTLKKLSGNKSSILFEGDIIISPEQLDYYMTGRNSRHGLEDKKYKWRNKIIPYRIKKGRYTCQQRNEVKSAMKEIEKVSCLKFVPYNKKNKRHRHFVTVLGDKPGCSSEVGRQPTKAEQFVYLSYRKKDNCFQKFHIVHEFLHTLGFYHMHGASNRNEHIKIIWGNILEGHAHEFCCYGSNAVTTLDSEYDYGSIMHFSSHAFAKDRNRPTIIPLKQLGSARMGQRKRLSRIDKRKINEMYCQDKRSGYYGAEYGWENETEHEYESGGNASE